MRVFPFLHHHEHHRGRQLRWVLPGAALAVLGILVGAAVFYEIADQSVSTEFFRAHKTVSHTGALLGPEVLTAAAIAVVVTLGAGLYGLLLTHRIVRPLHAIHLAVDALVAGDLGVRVDLHQRDEFQEVGESINRLAEGLRTVVAQLDERAQRIEAAASAPLDVDRSAAAEISFLAGDLRLILGRFRTAPSREGRGFEG